jgi:hypothetical protein
MQQFIIPLTWEMYGKIRVDAETLEDAIEYVLGPECPLPEGGYVDESVQVDYDLMKEMEGN